MKQKITTTTPLKSAGWFIKMAPGVLPRKAVILAANGGFVTAVLWMGQRFDEVQNHADIAEAEARFTTLCAALTLECKS